MRPSLSDSSLVHRSPAKINLYLRIGPRRSDGFHGLVSWFCKIGLADEITFAPAPGQDIHLSCDVASVPCGSDNLIVRAAQQLRPYATRPTGLNISLRKRIPMGAGLGGGSSNAATTLQAVSELWQCRIDHQRLHEIAAALGSDVPFFLRGPSAICRGRGEIVSPASLPRPTGVLVILPGIEMPTPAVYRKFDEMGLGSNLAAVEKQLPDTDLDTDSLLARLVNDLEAPAFALSPDLARLREQAEEILGRPVRMSGSGSTLFTLYDDEQQAAEAASILPAEIRSVACRLG